MKIKLFITFIPLTVLLVLTSCNLDNTNKHAELDSSKIVSTSSPDKYNNYLTGGNINGETQSYTNKFYKFSVKFPQGWIYEVDEKEVKPGEISSPDSGIDIYIDENKKDRLRIYGSVSRFTIPRESDYQINYFKTNSGIMGKLLSREYKERKEIYFYSTNSNKNYGVILNVSLDCFKRNEVQIMAVIGSMEILE